MKKNRINFAITLGLALSLVAFVSASAQQSTSPQAAGTQNPSDRTNSRILYHDGLVLVGTTDVYVIWYGCWDNTCGTAGDSTARSIVIDFLCNIGGSPYLSILRGYPNGSGQIPSGALFFGHEIVDNYSHGTELKVSDIQDILSAAITNHAFPQDPNGIYILISSADVSSPESGLCDPLQQPHHGIGEALGSDFRYAFVGNPMRCPGVAAPQFVSVGNLLPTPNGNLAGDGLASTLAHVLSTTITNPYNTGWFDRYGLQNADKCPNEFGATYLTPNGAQANVKWGQREYLIQANWLNDKKGRCVIDASQ